jgi:uncharacterized protein YndB with AHSA1/START domain
MIITVLLVVAIVIVVFLIVVGKRPADFSVTRSASINAPTEVVFAQVNDLRAWQAWSPWAKMDPDAKSTFDGPPSGTGASMAWAGNKKVGEGRMTIIESRPAELVRFKLEFFKPWQATNTAEFTFAASGGQTVVNWTMLGKNNFMAKVFGLFVDCDKMIGGCFEKGLAQMKSVAEAAGQPVR